jgi:(p)ppGpp synthase/HD superfamily hydrolase
MKTRALRLIARAFQDKKDKAGRPYVEHLLTVANNTGQYCYKYDTQTADDIYCAALLHDLLEDCEGYSSYDLQIFNNKVLDLVVTLTHVAYDSYDTYIDRIINYGYDAMVIKKCDLEDNMDITRLPELKDKDLIRLQKYHKAWHKINTKLKELK